MVMKNSSYLGDVELAITLIEMQDPLKEYSVPIEDEHLAFLVPVFGTLLAQC